MKKKSWFFNIFLDDGEEKPLKGEESSLNVKRISKESKGIKKDKINKIPKKVKFEEEEKEKESKKIKENNENLVGDFLKSEIDDQGMQSFGEKIEFSIELIKKNYDVDDLRLKFIQAQILLKENSQEAFIEKIFDTLIASLKLESEIQVNHHFFELISWKNLNL